jgi:hypothetical protein
MDTKGEALLISTPRGQNWFYDVFVRGQDPEQPDYASWHFPTSASPYIDDKEIIEAEHSLPAIVFEQEILAEFVSNAAAVFRVGDSALESIQPLVEKDDAGEIVRKTEHVVMGIDLAKHRDFTVLTAADSQTRKPVYHERFNAVSWPIQRQKIRDAIASLEDQGCEVTVCVDSTGIGDVIFDDLEAEGYDVIPIKFTPQWKQMAVTLLGADIERGGAFILPEQLHEFRQYQYEISETTGRFKFSAPENGHDDEVSAKLLEHWAINHFGVPDVQMFEMGSGAPIIPEYAGLEEPQQKEGEAETVTLQPPTMDDIFARGN